MPTQKPRPLAVPSKNVVIFASLSTPPNYCWKGLAQLFAQKTRSRFNAGIIEIINACLLQSCNKPVCFSFQACLCEHESEWPH
jgi:hypothetical protein